MEIFTGVDIPLWVVLLPTCLLLLYRYLTSTFDTWSSQGVKGPQPLPLLGTAYKELKHGNFVYVDPDLRREYGNVVGIYSNRQPCLIVSDPELVRQAMIKEFSSMPNRRVVNIGESADMFLTVLGDDHWRHVRTSISPTFTTGKLKQMKSMVDDCSHRLLEHIERTGGQPFESKQLLGAFTMDTICSTAFGIQIDSQSNPKNPTVVHANAVMGNVPPSWTQKLKMFFVGLIILVMPHKLTSFLIWLGFSVINSDAIEYFTSMSENIIASRSVNDSTRMDFIQLCRNQLVNDPRVGDPDTLVDEKGHAWTTKGLTKKEIVANAILFFIAGYDTTANTLSYLFYELALNQEVQEKLYSEIDNNITSSKPSYEDISKIDYLEWVLNETMRLYPLAPRIDRQVIKEVMVDGIRLPEGSVFTASIYNIHHDPETWPDPYKFDPERFTPENKEGRHPCAWIPFGVGNRNCIGMRLALLEMKIAIVAVLKQYRLEPCEGTPKKPLKFKKNFNLHTESPVMLRAVKRS